VLATVADGYLLLDGPKVTSRTLPGQLGAEDVDRVQNSSEGTLFSERDDRLPIWRLGANGWEVASLAPPVEIDPANEAAELEKGAEEWYETRVLVAADGSVYTVNGTAVSAGTRTTARRVAGKIERLGRETSSLNPSASFITPDGSLWNAAIGEIRRFQKGRWEMVGRFDGTFPSFDRGALTSGRPPWLLFDSIGCAIWRLAPGGQGTAPSLKQCTIREGSKIIRVDGAIAWSEEAVLLATDVGLRLYSPATETLSPFQVSEPKDPATKLTRDGRGRLWLGCKKGLFLIEPNSKALLDLKRLPWLGQSEVYALAPDPKHDDGIIAALGERGVAFVRARPER
jgi:hypothetical protein